MDGEVNANNADLQRSSIVAEISENPSPETSPSSFEQEVNNEKSLDTDSQDDSSKQTESETTDVEDTTNNAENEPLQNGKCNGSGSQKRLKRNVSFPTETLVMGFLEAPDPWKNAPHWKTEDLLKAYKLSCDKHGTKPLNKIMQQLQCIENVGERYEILSLKGERLDMKQCESLEEIFKRVRFRCVDLEASHLDDEMAVAIFEMVEYYESACKLNISFNKSIGPRGWQSCARLVRKTPCLTFIDARNCDLNERVIPILGRSLRMGCFLSRLQLQNANLAGRALVILVAALKMNEILKELFIGDNKLMPTDGVQIGNLLKYNHKLELLDLRNNHLQDVGTGHICDGLAEQNLDTGLLTLVLWNNQITFQAMASVNKALTVTANLETMNLGHNPITNEGIHILKDGLLKSRSLLKLGMSGTKVTCEGAVALAEFIADSHRLVRLDLQENDIKTAGLMALSLALKMNESLTRLELDRETKKESGVKDYIQQQKRLQQEITTLLEKNRDIAHQLEEEKRQIELKNKENARKLEEAAKDIETSRDTSEYRYIPSEDKIHRPKLLFIPSLSRENELESPKGSEFVQPHCCAPQLTLSSTAATDLLSPQYCPNPKATAKKLFSVTRVLSPTLSSPVSDSIVNPFSPTCVAPSDILNTTANIPVPHLCPPLPEVPDLGRSVSVASVLSPASPCSIQKAIEDHTLVSYIQQIISDSTNIFETTQSDKSGEAEEEVDSGTETGEPVPSDSESNIDEGGDDEKERIKYVLNSPSCGDKNDNSVDVGVRKGSDTSTGEEPVLDSTSDLGKCISCDVNDDTKANETDCDIDTSNIPEETVTQGNYLDGVSPLDGAEKDTKGSGNSGHGEGSTKSDLDKDSEPTASQTDVSDEQEHVEYDSTVDSVKCVAEDSELNSEFVDCLSLNSSSELKCDVDDPPKDEAPAGVDNNDQTASSTEQWNTVNKSDILDNVEGGSGEINSDNNANTKKPDFHTNLSLNGLKQELASLIDEGGNPTFAVEQTDGALVETGEENKSSGVDLATDWIDASSSEETSVQTNSS